PPTSHAHAQAVDRRAASALVAPLLQIVAGLPLAWIGQVWLALACLAIGMLVATWRIARMLGGPANLAARNREDADAWEARRRQLQERAVAARQRLLTALNERGAPGEDVRSTWLAYRSGCEA